jgi:hypothetical protein
MSVEAMKRALEALDLAQSLLERSQHHAKILSAYEYLRQTIKESEKREWVSLSEKEVQEIFDMDLGVYESIEETMRQLEEKNH